MRSSDGRSSLGESAGWLVALLAFAVVAVLRPIAADRFFHVKTKSDVYPLPPPEQTIIASLGYRAAFADAIFAHVRVAYGIAAGEQRRLEFAGEYLDAINELDPSFRDPYTFADTFLVLTPEMPRLEHYQKAREVYLRGLKNRPYDTDLWSSAGQYLAYLAAPHLPPDMKHAWLLEGAKLLARACELAGNNENVPYQCMTAASIYSNAGEREAAIDAARRLLQVTDDPEIEQRELGFLRKKLDEREADHAERRKALFRTAWKADLPFVSKNQLLVLGPHVDVASCAGLAHAEAPECAPTWKSWARHADPVHQE